MPSWDPRARLRSVFSARTTRLPWSTKSQIPCTTSERPPRAEVRRPSRLGENRAEGPETIRAKRRTGEQASRRTNPGHLLRIIRGCYGRISLHPYMVEAVAYDFDEGFEEAVANPQRFPNDIPVRDRVPL
eukprot:1749669-Pyramimonas_sp.AAC.2